MTRSAVALRHLSPVIRPQRVGALRRSKCQRRRSVAEPEGEETVVGQTVTAEYVKEKNVTEAVDTLQQAVTTAKFDTDAICAAFLAFQQSKIKFEDLSDVIGGGPYGKYWQLQFVARLDDAKGVERSGYRFPLTAIQHFDNGRITNGAYLGHLASIKFEGTYEAKKSSIQFVFEKMQIQIGPGRFTFPVGTGSAAEGRFVFFYANDEFLVARGMSGGTAFWKRVTPSDLLQLGAA